MALLLFICISFLQAAAQKKNLLSGKFSKEELHTILIPQAKWVPFPKISDREGWAKADQGMMTAYLKEAEQYLNYKWPSVPATKSLLIERTGNRSEFEAISFEKRQVLGTLLLAEIFENKGRFIDPLIDGVYSICEETWWGSPAHLPKSKEYAGLMDVSQPFVELFSAETAAYLSWVDYFLGEKLDAVSPQIRKRIYYEVNNRIFQPLMTKPHGWMTTNANGRRPNNWNPWICSNWLNAALLLEKDEDKRVNMIAKLLTVLDEFVNPYPQDGGCDEGPGYWGAAAASLYDNIAMLNGASNNAFQYVYDDEKIKNMGRFIYRAQINEKYFLNFADADPQPGMDGNMIYRFGKDINDADMMKFGAYYRQPETGKMGRHHYFRNFYQLFLQNEYQKAAKGLPLPENVWLPDIQVMIARDKQGTTKGFFVAAKGGNNDESHNHNDIGNYVVYYDGLPLLIDVGRGTYTAKTFSSRRYEIWYNCSDYHNVPTINGVTQPPGAQFKASNVNYQQGKAFSQLSLDIASSYPEAAGVNSWQRTIRLNRGKNVTVTDNISLKKADKLTEHLMTCYPAEVVKPGELVIHYAPKDAAAKDFVITYNPAQMQPTIEKVSLTTPEDKGIIQKWGDTIYRINFNVTALKANDKINFVIKVK
ncbi:MAG: heparinase II/III family protein [Flavisolibacter sp.]|nr:heparinase II/III family protein [Flavisolibacter sp.]